MSDLRTLAQAVVDADCDPDDDETSTRALVAASNTRFALGQALGFDPLDDVPVAAARAILRTQSFRALATLCAQDACNLIRVCT